MKCLQNREYLYKNSHTLSLVGLHRYHHLKTNAWVLFDIHNHHFFINRDKSFRDFRYFILLNNSLCDLSNVHTYPNWLINFWEKTILSIVFFFCFHEISLFILMILCIFSLVFLAIFFPWTYPLMIFYYIYVLVPFMLSR